MISLKNFRHQIMISIVMTTLLLWGGGFFIFNNYISSDINTKQIENYNFEKRTIERNLKNNEKKLTSTINVIMKLLYQKNTAEKIENKISSVWPDLFLRNEKKVNLFYYNSNFHFKKIQSSPSSVGDFDLSNDNEIPNHMLKKIINLFEGKSLIHCKKTCYLSYIKPIYRLSENKSLLQTRITFHDILNELIDLLKGREIIILHKKKLLDDSQVISINDIQYRMLLSSRLSIFNTLKNQLSKKNLKEKTKAIDLEHAHYIVDYIELEKFDDIIILIIKDSTDIQNKLNSLHSNYLKLSSIVLFFIMGAFIFFLYIPIRRIHHVKEALSTIGNGNFQLARQELQNTKREKTYDELDMIHSATYQLAARLETMHQDLRASNLQLSKKVSEVSFLADHDTLTGLYNRRRFNEELMQTYNNSAHFSLASIDMNHFKILNDSMGHNMGDKLLKKFSHVLVNGIREKGIVGRTGGDEFSVILLESNRNLIADLLASLVKDIKNISLGEGIIFKSSASIGVAVFPDDTDSLDDLTAFSDAAMYENKRFKIKDFNFYTGDETLLIEEKESQYWNRIIEETLKKKNIELFFQPIFFSENKKLYSVEVLSRIIAEDNRLLEPDLYISRLEKNHLIMEYDKIVFEKTLLLCNTLPKQPRLMINLSYYSLSSEDAGEYFIKQCFYHKFLPSNIIFEITERTEINDFSIALKFIENLKKHGFSFALDDFGSGFSSFNYLLELPITYLKIDKKIVTGLLKNPMDHHVLESIILLTKKLKIKIIAEGIENKKTYDILKTYDIDFLQGYYFSHPLSTKNFIELQQQPRANYDTSVLKK